MDRTLSLEFARVVEAAALRSGRLLGRGQKDAADGLAVDAMRQAFDSVRISGTVVIGEGEIDEAPMLYIGEHVGAGGPEVDIAVDPIEGTNLIAKGQNGAIAVMAIAEKGGLLHAPDMYMEKLCVGPRGAGAIDITKSLTENIKNKVVIITGASSGLGEATALLLAKYGAKVVLAARRKERLEKIASQIISQGGEALLVVADVAIQSDVERIAQETLKRYGRIDVLINNAGIMPQATLDKLKVEEWDKMIDINVKGVLYGIAAVLPTMQQQHSGHIINLSSVAGLRVAAGRGTVYSGTKFAVKAISEGLRVEVAKDNIRVTTLYPGAVESELKYGSSDPEASENIQAFYKAYEIPASSVARAIAYAINEPEEVAINEITLRPTRQEF